MKINSKILLYRKCLPSSAGIVFKKLKFAPINHLSIFDEK